MAKRYRCFPKGYAWIIRTKIYGKDNQYWMAFMFSQYLLKGRKEIQYLHLPFEIWKLSEVAPNRTNLLFSSLEGPEGWPLKSFLYYALPYQNCNKRQFSLISVCKASKTIWKSTKFSDLCMVNYGNKRGTGVQITSLSTEERVLWLSLIPVFPANVVSNNQFPSVNQ